MEAQEKRRLDTLYFDEDLEGAKLPLRDNNEEEQYLSMSTARGEIPTILELAYIYYYGLRGEQQNFQKAFEYFLKAANKGDTRAKALAGTMLVKGMGVEKERN